MVEMYCSHHHRSDGLCAACTEIADYADRKLDLCPYGPDKPSCTNCPIHCYRAGPRMAKTHPYLAVMHIFDDRREPPPLPERQNHGSTMRTKPGRSEKQNE
jgi:hypothetical protein